MNLFRILGDAMHLLSIFVLIWKIHHTKSVAGLSLHTQILYAIVFATRYMDLFVYHISLYNTLMKIFFIASSWYILYLMVQVYRGTRNKEDDYVRTEFFLIPCGLLSIVWNHGFTRLEVRYHIGEFVVQ
jgi:ER lumen protein retaining receptor